MKSLHLTAHIGTDGILCLPITEFAEQDVEVVVVPRVRTPASASILCGQNALDKARDVGFIGSFDAEPNFSVRYKEEIDWSSKT